MQVLRQSSGVALEPEEREKHLNNNNKYSACVFYGDELTAGLRGACINIYSSAFLTRGQ